MVAASYTFVIVADGDSPVYEAEFLAAHKKDGSQDTSHLNQLIIHAALDMVDDAVWTNNAMCARSPCARNRAGLCATPGNPHGRGLPRPARDCSYLKAVDKFNELLISAYVTPGRTRMMVLHDVRNDEGIRAFLHDVHELYVKALLNPFHAPHLPLRSATFDARVRALAKKYLT